MFILSYFTNVIMGYFNYSTLGYSTLNYYVQFFYMLKVIILYDKSIYIDIKYNDFE